MLDYSLSPVKPASGVIIDSFVTEYKSGYEEFRVLKIQLHDQHSKVKLKFNTFSVAVVINGEGQS
jgi:hypothetical protein